LKKRKRRIYFPLIHCSKGERLELTSRSPNLGAIVCKKKKRQLGLKGGKEQAREEGDCIFSLRRRLWISVTLEEKIQGRGKKDRLRIPTSKEKGGPCTLPFVWIPIRADRGVCQILIPWLMME